MRRLFTAFGLACLSFAPAGCAKSESVSVPYAASDLRDDVAVAQLYQRIETAAESLCATAHAQTPASLRECRDNTVAHAIDRADVPALTAEYQEAVATRVALAQTETLAAR